MRLRIVIPLCVVSLAIPAIPLGAQIPEKFENLQVLPKDIPRDTLIAIMRGFAGSLGVRCTYCHVEREAVPGAPPGGGGGLNLNFASDDKAPKKKARFMLRMTDSLNTAVLPRVPERHDPPVTVGCITCHRGLPLPATIEGVLLETTSRLGVDSAIARYRQLRSDMVSGRYNFSEVPVSEVARKLAEQGKHAEAIALLQMLQEFYPNSVNIDFQLAELYIAKGDRDAGIARLRGVLTKNPNDRRARQRLQQLGVQP
jgi:tetratricopeptide repeat protein/photosynthetic reaction center cytochrome c subunit